MYDHGGGWAPASRAEVELGGVLACAFDRAGSAEHANRERQRLEHPVRLSCDVSRELERALRVADRNLHVVTRQPDAPAVTVNRRLQGVRSPAARTRR